MNGNPPAEYKFQASASSVSGDLQRPSQITVPPEKAVLLGGKNHVCKRLLGLNKDGLISFKEAYLEVAGSYDEDHKRQTSYALTIIDGLNIAGMLTADRVVSRVLVYSPAEDHFGEHTFDITGSYFDNLRIAGHRIDLKLDTFRFYELNSYTKFVQAYASKQADNCFLFNELGNQKPVKQNELIRQYSALKDAPGIIQQWQTYTQKPANGPYQCSAASHLNFKDYTGPKSELEGYGAVICIPKFGVIRLAEVEITEYSRTLNMFRVDMCSTANGTATGGTTVGGPVPPAPPLKETPKTLPTQ